MLQKLKMTAFATVLCLFGFVIGPVGFVLVPAAPVFAASADALQKQFNRCEKKLWRGQKVSSKKYRKCTNKLGQMMIDSKFSKGYMREYFSIMQIHYNLSKPHGRHVSTVKLCTQNTVNKNNCVQ